MERKEVNLLDYVFLLYKSRKFILFNFLIVVFVAAGASLLLPNYYKSAVLLMPPNESRKAFGFAEQLVSSVTTLRLGSQGSPSDLFIGIMKSQSMGISLVDKFNLVKYYNCGTRDAAIAILKSQTRITVTKEGLVKIEYEDKNPLQSATICNMYVVTLDSLNQTLNRRSSRERADFIEQMLTENTVSMKQAEMDLKKFQDETKAISPYQQQRVSLSVTAELEMDIMSKENELKELRAKSFTEANPLVQDMVKKIQFRREQLNFMRFGNSESEGRETLFVPLQKAPALTLEYEKLSRRLETLGILEQLLRQQYEESRIEQMNTTSTVSILDRAHPPMNHFRPKRSLIVLISGAASLFFSVITIIIIEFFSGLSMMSPEHQKKIAHISRFLRIDR